MLSIMDEKIAHVHAHTHAHTHTRKPLFLDSQKDLSSPPLPGPGVEGRSFFVRYPPRPPGAGQPVRVPGGGGAGYYGGAGGFWGAGAGGSSYINGYSGCTQQNGTYVFTGSSMTVGSSVSNKPTNDKNGYARITYTYIP